jgi:hypothetical protein
MKTLSLFLILLYPLLCSANTYYVTKSGNDTNTGLSIDNAWLSIAYSATKVKPGDIVYIKAGLYPDEFIDVKNSGIESAQIIFQGYENTPGDVPSIMPVIQGKAGIICMGIDKRSNIEIRNLSFENCFRAIYCYGSNHIVFDNITMNNIGIESSDGEGISLYLTDNFTIKNCKITDAGMVNFAAVRCNNGLIENCTSYAIEYIKGSTDYHIILQDSKNVIIKNCEAYNLHSLNGGHPGHGIGIKDTYRGGYQYPHSNNNKIINCSAYDMGEYFFVAHEAYNNEFENCTAIGHYENPLQNYWSEGINIRDGAHDNMFKNCIVKSTRTSIAIQNTEEGPVNTDGVPIVQICYGNLIYNSKFVNSISAIEMWSSNNNTFRKCEFDSVNGSLIRIVWEAGNDFNVIDSSNILNAKNLLSDNWKSGTTVSITNSNFWNNGFTTPAGNTAINPYIPVIPEIECQAYKDLLNECLTVFYKTTISAKLKKTMRGKIISILK